MTCERIVYPNGDHGWMCSRGPKKSDPDPPCSVCGKPSDRLCDGEVSPGKTCDAPLCERCSVSTPPLVTLPVKSFARGHMGHTKAPQESIEDYRFFRGIIAEELEPDSRDFCPRHSAGVLR